MLHGTTLQSLHLGNNEVNPEYSFDRLDEPIRKTLLAREEEQSYVHEGEDGAIKALNCEKFPDLKTTNPNQSISDPNVHPLPDPSGPQFFLSIV
jgi:hypothetical protein